MLKYKFIDHKADMFIEAYGATFQKALENAAEGLFETSADSKKLKETKKIKIRESARSLEELSTFLLTQLVAEADAREMMFREMKVKKFGKRGKKFFIEAEAMGQEAVHKLGRMYVKAVTHHESSVMKGKNGWKIRVLLDI